MFQIIPLKPISQDISVGNNSSKIPVNQHSLMPNNGKSNDSLTESMLSTENGINLKSECASENSNSPGYFSSF